MRVTSKLLLIAIAAGLLVWLAVPAGAQQYPNVANLQPFTAQANYMSLPGYLRWVNYRDTGSWLTYQEAQAIVVQQGGTLYGQAR